MADLRGPADDDAQHRASPALQDPQLADKDAGDAVPADKHNGDAGGGAPKDKERPRTAVDAALAKHVGDVMASELGIPTLLNRLKQSIASAKEFGLFLKRRSVLEDDHASGLKKLCRLTQESARRPEHRQGSFAQSYDEMVFIHDRMAENGSQFAASLHQMYEDLLELAANAERGRKSWKTNGLAAEQKVADLEQAMRKSKAKYDSLAEEYDRARTGEARQSGKVLGAFKAHKSAAQQEEDLLKKVQAADQVYQGHVNALQTEKSHLVSATRPEAVRALQELITETDSGVALQMQKFAAFNEKLLLGNGLIISPFKNQGGASASQPRSLREAVAAIDNTKDLNEFVAAHYSKIQPKPEVKYERNPLLAPQGSSISQPTPLNMHPSQGAGANLQSVFSQPTAPTGSRSSTGNFGPANPAPPSQDQPRPPQQPHSRSFSQGNMLGGQQGSPQQPFASRNSAQPPPRSSNGVAASSQGPPQLGALPFQGSQLQGSQFQVFQLQGSQFQVFQLQGSQPPAKQTSPQQSAPPFQTPQDKDKPDGRFASAQAMGAPSKPVFGVSLTRMYERDGMAVPMVVQQCIQAVDLFGLGVEGIYRQSGSLNHINKLKGMFDADAQNPALDFRNPESFYHDVNSVTGLLKQFFRDLPDPLLTGEHHDAFIASAKKDDEIARRDSLHAIINELPDPNYATLRALTLHLYRVMDNSHVNRMNSHNLAVIFGPTLMGSDPSTAIADAGWQIKVIDTILQNTYQIFDDD